MPRRELQPTLKEDMERDALLTPLARGIRILRSLAGLALILGIAGSVTLAGTAYSLSFFRGDGNVIDVNIEQRVL